MGRGTPGVKRGASFKRVTYREPHPRIELFHAHPSQINPPHELAALAVAVEHPLQLIGHVHHVVHHHLVACTRRVGVDHVPPFGVEADLVEAVRARVPAARLASWVPTWVAERREVMVIYVRSAGVGCGGDGMVGWCGWWWGGRAPGGAAAWVGDGTARSPPRNRGAKQVQRGLLVRIARSQAPQQGVVRGKIRRGRGSAGIWVSSKLQPQL